MESSPKKQIRRGMEAFASRDFRRYQLARGAVVLGAEAQAVAVAWQVYSLTHRALDLGYTGLALFLPGLLFLLPAGHVADRFDRRQIILVCYGLQLFCTAALLALTFRGTHGVFPIYEVLFVMGMARAFSGPASSALVPHMVPEEHFVNAVTWGGAIWQFANITGPALGGFLFTLPLLPGLTDTRLEGAAVVYLFTLGTLVWFLVLVGLLGGATARRPIFAHEVLHQGPRGLGLLRAAPAAGAVAMSLVMARFPLRRGAGKRLFVCVAIFGVATVIFGLSHSLWLSLASLALAGAADSVSVIIRGSLVQLGTPPEMRGRVSAVNSLFIGASNELGSFESGLTAQWWGAVRATIVGGVGALVVAGLWAGLFPGLRRADELTVESLRRAADDTPAA